MLAAMIVTSLAERQPGLARLAKRSTTGGLWIIIAVLIPAGLFFIATAIVAVFYGDAIEWAKYRVQRRISRSPRHCSSARLSAWQPSFRTLSNGSDLITTS
jgi:hypothetical protein